MHQHAEISDQEFQTTENIIKFLVDAGVGKDSIVRALPTGLWFDLHGKGDAVGKEMMIAIRADIDALKNFETNESISYKSKE